MSRDERRPDVRVHHLDVFAREPGGGNPCPVVIGAERWTDDEMRSLAAEFGEETAFVQYDPDGALRLRFFVPRHEMSMCVHATIAAVTVLVAAGDLAGGAAVVRTASGDCAVSWDEQTPPQVGVEQQEPRFGPPVDLAEALEPAAGLAPGDVDRSSPIRAVSVSRAKLIVPVRTAEAVHAARPDPERLWAICRQADTTGAYLYAPHPDGRPDHVVARQFPVDAGYPEDPATGVAAGALVVHLADLAVRARAGAGPDGYRLDVDIDQGDAMGRPSRIRASAFTGADGRRRTTVSGRAVAQSKAQNGSE